MPGKLFAGGTCQICMMRDESWYGSGRRRTASTTEKIAVLAPMPRASSRTAVTEKPGLRTRVRRPCRSSETRLRMGGHFRVTQHAGLAGDMDNRRTKCPKCFKDWASWECCARQRAIEGVLLVSPA